MKGVRGILMQKPGWQALFLITGVALAWAVQAQAIYRCGNAYSQAPCRGAVPMDLSDARQPEQKKQTEAAAIADARLANTMAQERLAEEQRLLKSNQPPPPSASGATADEQVKTVSAGKKRSRSKAKKSVAASAGNPVTENQMIQRR